MTSILSLVKMPASDIERIRQEFPEANFQDAAGWFDGEYAQTWPSATAIRYVRGKGQGTRADRDALLAAADVIIAGFPFPLDLLVRSPNLKWVHQTPAGASNLRRGDIWGAEIPVTTSRGLGETTAIAEYVMASTMYFLKGFFRAKSDLEDQVMRHLPFDGRAIETKTMCIIGAGGIGREVGRLAKAMGMTVIGTRRSLAAAPGDEFFDRLEKPAALPGQLGEANVIAVCCQWTPATTNLLDDQAFAAMPDDCIVVNVARGEIVDEDALYRALESGRLRGAALDVFVGEFEHLPPDRLWSHPRVLITPHTSGMTDTSRRRSTDLFCANLRRLLGGQPLQHLVDWDRGY